MKIPALPSREYRNNGQVITEWILTTRKYKSRRMMYLESPLRSGRRPNGRAREHELVCRCLPGTASTTSRNTLPGRFV